MPNTKTPPAAVSTVAPAHPFHFSDILDASFWRATVHTAGQVVEIVVIYLLLKAGLRRLIHRVLVPAILRTDHVDGIHSARLRTLAGLLNSIASYVLTFIFGIMLLRAFNLDPIPLLTTASVAGLAVGFGAQKLVKDVISGFFIILENQYAVGDYVTIGTVTGVVEDVGMRTTRIRDDVGKLYTLSNGDISQVCNQSRGAVATFIEIGVATGSDISKATEIVNQAGNDLAEERKDLEFVKPPSVQGLAGMEAAKVTLRVTCATERPARLMDAQIALRSLIHQRLVDAGIALA